MRHSPHIPQSSEGCLPESDEFTNIFDQDSGQPCLVVGIGASAGGLEALQQFFSIMSPCSGLAFVVVQHLSPDYKSLLAEILGKHTRMSVVQAENEMEVVPDCVYLIPPKNNMILREGRLHLKAYGHGGVNHPIDIFFHSLAEEMRDRSIAVVLSGTGTDGTNGIKSIKEQGGLVIVQDPANAKFDGMPKSALNTGLVDFVLTSQAIPNEILNFANYPTVMRSDNNESLFSNEEILARIYQMLKKTNMIDYTHYKRTTILRRIERRMVVTHKENLNDYVELLMVDTDEVRILGREILIGVTNFFRDPSYFEMLKHNVIRSIVSNSTEKDPIRVWVAGCFTGEEAYSIAILFVEIMSEMNVRRDLKIFATDLDAEAVEKASKGVYSESIIDDVSHERLTRFFMKKSDKYIVSKEIRKLIIFAPHNVFQDPPFGKLDLISCRNVMIYFQPVLQKTLFSIFHAALKSDGFLFLGKSETPGEYADVFAPLCIQEKIFRHKMSGHAPEVSHFAYMAPRMPTQVAFADEPRTEKIPQTLEDSYCRFLEQFLPPSVVINEQNNIVHIFGDFNDYLHLTKGRALLNIFNLISEDLSLVVSTALNRARSEKIRVSYLGIDVAGKNGMKRVDLVVQPILDRRELDTGLTAIVFSGQDSMEPVGFTEKYDINKTAAQRIVDLEHELQDSQESLKNTIGELETVNEELQAANEELLTANEELQSSNEELQSVNEELYTVNAEYQQKLEELQDLNNDISNFLSSTMIGILFVDNSKNIRKFTDYIGREFDLMEQDVGRPMHILSHHFKSTDLTHDAAHVLKTLVPLERELHAINGKHYTSRISPYRTTENSIKGLVITIIDSLNPQEKTE